MHERTTMTPAPRPGTIESFIMALLKADPRDQWSPKEIAAALRREAGTIRKALVRLARRRTYEGHPFIMSKNGRYRAWIGRDELEVIERAPYELHCIQAQFHAPPNGPRGDGVAARQAAPFTWSRNEVADQFIGKAVWENRNVTVILSRTGNLQVSLDADRTPLSFLEHEQFWAWAHGSLTGVGLLWVPEFAVLDNVEVSQDYKRLALSGGKGRRIMLRTWRNGWAQQYQKEPWRLRSEFHWAKDETETVSIQEAMSWGPPRPSEPAMDLASLLGPLRDDAMFG